MRIKIREYKTEDGNIKELEFRDNITGDEITRNTKEICLHDRSNFQESRLELPETYKGLPIVRIGWYAFNTCTSIEEVIIPNTLKEIGNYAFSYCINLKEINIPSSVKKIGISSFYECKNLRADIKYELINKWGCDIR